MVAEPLSQALPAPRSRLRRWRHGAQRLARRKPLGAASLIFLTFVTLAAVFAPLAPLQDPYAVDYEAIKAAPSAAHWAGTDTVGRDQLSRLVYAARISLGVGLVSVLLGVSAGSLVGLAAGYGGGLLDLAVMRVVDILMAFPMLVFVLALVSIFGSSVIVTTGVIGVALVPLIARTVRGVVLSLREREFVTAARALGAGTPRIVFRHILPNCAAPIIVLASVMLGGAIVVEASLSFLGLGVQPPTPSWGQMLSGPTRTHMESAPWLVIGPAVAIGLTVLSFNLLGDAIRDLLDPRLRT